MIANLLDKIANFNLDRVNGTQRRAATKITRPTDRPGYELSAYEATRQALRDIIREGSKS